MASSYTNEGLIDMLAAALGTPVVNQPVMADLLVQAFVPSPKLTFADLQWSQTFVQGIQSLWIFNLIPSANYATANAKLTFDFSSGNAGLVFYGIGIHDRQGTRLYYCETFPVPYIVPNIGGSFQWQFNMTAGDCLNL